MPEVVKSPALLIIAVIVLIVLAALVFDILFSLKIGRGVCSLLAQGIVSIFSMGNILSGVGDALGKAFCNSLPF
jgi:hypothetical protein